MPWPSKTTGIAAVLGGALNVATVLALYARGDYPTLSSTAGTSVVVVTAFTLGFVAVLVAAHTRLVSPAAGYLAVLAGTAYLELSTPSPEWGELNGHVIVDGPTYVLSYANTWYVWLALLLYAGAVEFGIRRGYGVGDHRLRHLPDVPLSRSTIVQVVAAVAGFVGLATVLLVLRAGIRPPSAAIVVLVLGVAVAAVPLAALLSNGILLPTVLFAALVPYALTVEVFVATDSPVHILLFGPYAIVLAVAWGVEKALRTRVSGWDGGRFDASTAE